MSTPVQLNPSMYTLARELSVPWGDVRGSSREKREEVEGGEEIPDIIAVPTIGDVRDVVGDIRSYDK